MVARLAAAGHQVRALGRTEENRAALAELGATPVAEVADAAAGAEVVVVCVFTDEQVGALCLEPGPGRELPALMPAGSVLVLHTTGSPATAAAVAERAAGNAVAVLDAPVSGGPHDIAAGSVTVFVGGDRDALDRARPALACYADPIVHAGPTGAGQKTKLVNNALFAAQVGLVAEAVTLGARLGLTEPALLAALPHGSGASAAMGNIARAGSAATFIAAVAEFIGKDVAVVRATAAELGTDLGRLDPLVDAGLGR
ncbi:6-phosphogluconate dehydrogenase [Mycolicibacterium fallax]|uniref:6-phosphogluconate dehydrogenase n=2 Tax=Mycolicibacterium fallax TaxID=1793 RepID=A0A1X1RHY7_MYCFA|nr:6-phosphogluconate dehydrogenase [Mycolicibacterium fallax]